MSTAASQVRSLTRAKAATARELHAKFVEDGGTYELSFGGIDKFFGGLEGLIGPPSPQLAVAMEREHCGSVDSQAPFTTTNYGVTTTSQIEYNFVVDPDDALRKLGLAAWPVEEKLLEAQRALEAAREKSGGGWKPRGGADAEEEEAHAPMAMREARPLAAFEAETAM